MPFYFRKSVSAGPFRFNFSKGGVGMSVGVKGVRVGTGPRGHYVQAGRGGFYYRTSLGGANSRASPGGIRTPAVNQRRPAIGPATDDMIEVTSGDVLAMRESAFADVLADLNEKHRQISLSTCALWISLVFSVFTLMAAGTSAFPVFLIVPFAWFGGRWIDSFKRVAVLYYDVEDQLQERFKALCSAFDALAQCAGKWHIEAGKAVHDLTTWKRQAGASHLVRRNPLPLTYALPNVLRCNVTPPTLRVGRRTIYLLPDVALIHDSSGFGAVSYHSLEVNWQPSLFIESGGAPRDAEIDHYTWEHPNKSGGPDKRFKSNRQIPVCRYDAVHLKSASGVNELLEFSRRGLISTLAQAIRSMPKNLSAEQSPRIGSG